MSQIEDLVAHEGENAQHSLLRYVDEVPTGESPLLAEVTHQPVVSSRFNTDNEQAIPVWERSSEGHRTVSVTVSETTQLVGRRRGRKYVALSVPTSVTRGGVATTPNGVQVSHDRNSIDVGIGYQLNPGDSLEIDSEAPVYVGPLPGLTSGVVQYSEALNYPNGSLE